MRKKHRLGKAFPDEFKKVTSKSAHFHRFGDPSAWQENLIAPPIETDDTENVSSWRKLVFYSFVLITFAIFALRLINLQIVDGKDNRQLADSNRIQIRIIHAPRGVIYDRNGKILAQNEPGFRLVDPNHPNAKTQYLGRDQAMQMEINKDPKYQNLEIDTIRSYPFGKETTHILGYVSEIAGDEMKDPKYAGYKLGDKIGRGGVEETYEKVLRGADGGEVIEVDAEGRQLRTITQTPAVPGQSLYLSIDEDLQHLAYTNLESQVKKVGSCCGAVVAENPQNGEILALVSYPSYDPKDLANAVSAANSPMLDRAISGTYPPGSTFKIASSLAGLSSGKITSTTAYEDTGVMQLGPYSFANWYFSEYGRKEAGSVNVIKALQRSNDIYFYQLGQTIGENQLGVTAKKLGLGQTLGIDIPGEVDGLIPDDAWKEKNVGDVWYPGDTLHMAIGQGYVLATPLQISNLISQVAANGNQYPPHLAYKITDPWGNMIKGFRFDPVNHNDFKLSDIKLVQEGLNLVPKFGGTAWPLFTFPIPTAGKTGTAEFGDPKNKTHAWYTAYAPINNPTLSITALVEAGGEGSTVASPIVKEMYRYYFSPDKKHLIRDTNDIATDSAKTLGE
jgi:penicillin-binding protein 2